MGAGNATNARGRKQTVRDRGLDCGLGLGSSGLRREPQPEQRGRERYPEHRAAAADGGRSGAVFRVGLLRQFGVCPSGGTRCQLSGCGNGRSRVSIGSRCALPRRWLHLQRQHGGRGLDVGLGLGRHLLPVLLCRRKRSGRIQLGRRLHLWNVLAYLGPTTAGDLGEREV